MLTEMIRGCSLGLLGPAASTIRWARAAQGGPHVPVREPALVKLHRGA